MPEITESCYFCNETECLEEHHIVPRRFDGSDKEENLVQVCPSCHRKLESLYDKRFYQSLGVRKGNSSGHAVFECVECNAHFVDDLYGELSYCPSCKKENAKNIRVNEVSDKFKRFERYADLNGCTPQQYLMVWSLDKSRRIKSIDGRVYESRIKAQELAWQTAISEGIESAGIMHLVSVKEIDRFDIITSEIL